MDSKMDLAPENVLKPPASLPSNVDNDDDDEEHELVIDTGEVEPSGVGPLGKLLQFPASLMPGEVVTENLTLSNDEMIVIQNSDDSEPEGLVLLEHNPESPNSNDETEAVLYMEDSDPEDMLASKLLILPRSFGSDDSDENKDKTVVTSEDSDPEDFIPPKTRRLRIAPNRNRKDKDEIVIHPDESDKIDMDKPPTMEVQTILQRINQSINQTNDPAKPTSYTFENWCYSEYRQKPNADSPIPYWNKEFYIECSDCCLSFKAIHFTDHLLDRHVFDCGHPKGLCTHCLVTFGNTQEYEDHTRLCRNFLAYKYTCLICCLHFNDDISRMKHIQENHFKTTMPYVCQMCNYRSSLMIQFREHMSTFHQRSFCHFCLLPFSASEGIHECEDAAAGKDCQHSCSKSISNSELTFQAIKHILAHLLVRDTNKCPRCTLSFLTSRELANHFRHGHSQSWSRMKSNKMEFIRFHLSDEQKEKVAQYSSEEIIERIVGKTVIPEFRFTDKEIEKKKKQKIEDEKEWLKLNEEGNTIYFHSALLKQKEIAPKLKDQSLIAQRFKIYCAECNTKICVSAESGKKPKEIKDHYAKTWKCGSEFPGCRFTSRCVKARKYHTHGIGTRTQPALVIAPKYQPYNMTDHLTLCVTCGHRSHSAEELVFHMHQNPNHIGFNSVTKPASDKKENPVSESEEDQEEEPNQPKAKKVRFAPNSSKKST